MSSDPAAPQAAIPTAPPPAGDDAEPVLRTTHFDFVNKVFKAPGAKFYKPDNFDEPVLVVDLGDLKGEIKFKHLRKQFNIEEDTVDDKLLATAVTALKYVEDIRPGDKIPNEILDGTASWSVSPRHRQLAQNRLEAQLISWISGKESEVKSAEQLNAYLSAKENKAQLRNAFSKAALQLGAAADDHAAVLTCLGMLSRELCFIEALREAFQQVPVIAVALNRVAEFYHGDMRMQDTVQRVRNLMRKGVQEYTSIFLDTDSQTGEIISAMKSLDRQILFIRERRDTLRYLQMKWNPYIVAWKDQDVKNGQKVTDLLGRTYRFLATRFDTSKSLMKARKEQDAARMKAQQEAAEAEKAKKGK
jgi:hypothetical protein